MLYPFLRERGREGARERETEKKHQCGREILIGCFPQVPRPAIWACAPISDRTCDLLVNWTRSN